MTKIVHLLEQLQETDSHVKHLADAQASNPDDEILKINADAVAKRRVDLARQLDYSLLAKHHDFVRYRINRTWTETYPIKAVAASIGAFQDLVTAVFDALYTMPKLRFRPSSDSIALSTMDFAGAASGSVLISMSVPNERLLVGETKFDEALQLVSEVLRAQEADTLKSLAEKVGIAAISKAYAWADVSTAHGLSTCISWGKEFTTPNDLVVSLEDATRVKDAIASKSDVNEKPETVEGILLGFDGATSYFHIETFDERRDIRGDVAHDLSRSWTTNRPYRATLNQTTQVKYATGEEKVSWTLLTLLLLEEEAPRPT